MVLVHKYRPLVSVGIAVSQPVDGILVPEVVNAYWIRVDTRVVPSFPGRPSAPLAPLAPVLPILPTDYPVSVVLSEYSQTVLVQTNCPAMAAGGWATHPELGAFTPESEEA